MSIRINTSYLDSFIDAKSIHAMQDEVTKAHNLLHTGTGEGSEYIGWLTLPTDYDKDEFSRIKKTAQKIKESCDLLIVIGIGGSYLGARAAIEFIKSQNYNALKKDTPDIFFAGNTISPS
ncbi:MAG: glucose-6-phosphate isomerase, partial [Oscillospiraceae bacterium]